MKKLVILAVSCLLSLCGATHAKTSSKQHKQNINKVKREIKALNKKMDFVVTQRDQLTARLKQLRQHYREEK